MQKLIFWRGPFKWSASYSSPRGSKFSKFSLYSQRCMKICDFKFLFGSYLLRLTAMPRTDKQFVLDKFLDKLFSRVKLLKNPNFFNNLYLGQFYETACCRYVRILHVYLPYRSTNKKRRSQNKIKLLLFCILKMQKAKFWKLHTWHTRFKR